MTRCRRLLARLPPAAGGVARGGVAGADPPPPPAPTRGPAAGAGETAAPVPVAAAGAGEPAVLYDASYALVIGAGNYEHWSRLTNVENEVREVANALRRRDFDVATLMDPTEGELRRTAEEFIYRYGYDPGNRLVLFFSGHGYTLDGHGYIVPVDAPDPTLDERGFAQTAIDMLDIMAWARKVRAKHALFAFDSCFAGTLFETKSLPDPTDAYVRGNIGRLAAEHNFPEYVDPWTGAAHGTRRFSWTAALALETTYHRSTP